MRSWRLPPEERTIRIPTLTWNVVRDGTQLRSEPADAQTRALLDTPGAGERARRFGDGVVATAVQAARDVSRPLPHFMSLTVASTWDDMGKAVFPHSRPGSGDRMRDLEVKGAAEDGRIALSPVHAAAFGEYVMHGAVPDAEAAVDLLRTTVHEVDHIVTPLAPTREGKRPTAMFGDSGQKEALDMHEARAELAGWSRNDVRRAAENTGLPFDDAALERLRGRPHFYDPLTQSLSRALTDAGLEPHGSRARQLLHATPIESPPINTRERIAHEVLDHHGRPQTPQQLRRASIFVNRRMLGHDVLLADVLPQLDAR